MTDKEIVKVLECCTIDNMNCASCPYKDMGISCVTFVLTDALNLINRQKAEIEKLEMAFEINANMVEELNNLNESIRAKAIKEFAERLKRKRHNYFPSIDSYCVSKKVVLLEDIVSLSKEMTESEE